MPATQRASRVVAFANCFEPEAQERRATGQTPSVHAIVAHPGEGAVRQERPETAEIQDGWVCRWKATRSRQAGERRVEATWECLLGYQCSSQMTCLATV